MGQIEQPSYPKPPARDKIKIKSNADRIRAMSDEELCQWIDRQYDEERLDWEMLGCYKCINYNTHHYPNDCGECEWKFGVLNWLKSDYKEVK